MHYVQTPLSGWAGVPAAIASFADGLGWTVSYGVHGLEIVAPSDDSKRPSPLAFVVTTDAALDGLIISFGVPGAPSLLASQTLLPVLTKAGDNTEAPSKITIFGGMSPEPWISAVLTFEFNYYRHIYMGYIERLGSYTGGEVFCVTNGPAPEAGSSFRDRANTSYLFTGISLWGRNGGGNCGAAHIVSPGDSNPVKYFATYNPCFHATQWQTDPVGMRIGKCIIGGFTDGPNDVAFARANAVYAQAQMLVPFNLYVSNAVGRLVPVGAPAGIRFVDLYNLTPEQTVNVGNTLYKVYPDCSRQAFIANGRLHDYPSGDLLGRKHTTGYLGYAFPEDSD